MDLQLFFKRSRYVTWSKVVTIAAILLGLTGCTISGDQLAGASAANPIEGDIFLPIINNAAGTTTNTVPDTSPDTVLTDTVGINAVPIPGQYIVVFKEDLVVASSVNALAANLAAQYGGTVLQNYEAALPGFTAQFPVETSAEVVASMQQDENVAYVEQDMFIRIEPLLVGEAAAASTEEISASAVDTLQKSPSWGLDRIDQRPLPLDNQYTYRSTGAGVRVYVIDSGIHLGNSDFGTRATLGGTFITQSTVQTSLVSQLLRIPLGQSTGLTTQLPSVISPTTDCNGHGTHMAGIVGGRQNGVAKEARLIAVKVLDCQGIGKASDIIKAVNWVTEQRKSSAGPMIALISATLANSTALRSAVENSIRNGVVYVVAAGDNNRDACLVSLATLDMAITVGATAENDSRAAFSNGGRCIDIFAPGSNIRSTWLNNSSMVLSSTTAAAAHVAGVVARYLQTQPPTTSVSAVINFMNTTATTSGVIDPLSALSNKLLYYQDGPPISTFATPLAILQNWYTSANGWEIDSHPRLVGDVNGDGKADLVGFANDGTYVSVNTNNSFAPGQNFLANYSLEAGGWTYNTPRLIGDVNGDGKADIVGFASDGVYLSLSTGTGFQTPVFTIPNYGLTAGSWTRDHLRLLGDVNGDGKADIVGFGNDGVYLSLSTGTGFQAPAFTIAAYGNTAGAWTPDHPRLVGDVNGDGKADIVGFANDGVYLALSTGSGFQAPVLTIAAYSPNAGGWTQDTPRLLGDVNGDGKADIIGFQQDGVYLSLSTGSSFQAPALTIPNYGTNAGGWTRNTPRLVGDVNGDGKTDIVGFGATDVFLSVATIR